MAAHALREVAPRRLERHVPAAASQASAAHKSVSGPRAGPEAAGSLAALGADSAQPIRSTTGSRIYRRAAARAHLGDCSLGAGDRRRLRLVCDKKSVIKAKQRGSVCDRRRLGLVRQSPAPPPPCAASRVRAAAAWPPACPVRRLRPVQPLLIAPAYPPPAYPPPVRATARKAMRSMTCMP